METTEEKLEQRVRSLEKTLYEVLLILDRLPLGYDASHQIQSLIYNIENKNT